MPIENAANIVKVSARIASSGAAEGDFGRTLFLEERKPDLTITASSGLTPHVEALSVKSFQSVAGVVAEFGANSEPAKAATAYYAQRPVPKDFVVGGYCPAGTLSYVRSDEVTSDADSLTKIKAASGFKITVGGKTTGVITTSGAASLGAALTLINTALNGLVDVAKAKVIWNATEKRFYFVFDPSDKVAVTDGVRTDTAGASTALGVTDHGSAFVGVETETTAESLARIRLTDPNWYLVIVSAPLNDTSPTQTVSTWCESAQPPAFFIAETAQRGAYEDTPTGNAKTILAGSPTHTAVVWSAGSYMSARVAGILSGINWNGTGIVNPMYANYAGAAPSNTLTYDKRVNLEELRVNYLFGGNAQEVLYEGWAGSGWIDNNIWIDWFRDALQVAGFNYLKRSPTRVPITEDGIAGLQAEFERVCERGIRNGGIAPGKLSNALANNLQQVAKLGDFDGELTTGYHVHHVPVSEQPQTEREARKAPQFTIWLKSSGVVNRIDLTVTLEN